MRTKSEVVETLLNTVIETARDNPDRGQVELRPAVVIAFKSCSEEFFYVQYEQTEQEIHQLDLFRLIWVSLVLHKSNVLPESVVTAIRAYDGYDGPGNGDLTTARREFIVALREVYDWKLIG
ncbi:hypothetical protein [Shimazuella kribbensis]|uniref:hypothetical protein n=1 Tax=Shimazuella kribbensis TaxID=139808 RepID=UPI000491A4E3|nr:hypothetical protein [Shimazuella kribbensis]